MKPLFQKTAHCAVKIIEKLHGFLVQLWLLPVRVYQKYLSGLKPAPTCRFRPSCSAYAVEAVREWGILVGTALALFRILRCNPFCKGGYDPVPEKAEVLAKWKRKKANPQDNPKDTPKDNP